MSWFNKSKEDESEVSSAQIKKENERKKEIKIRKERKQKEEVRRSGNRNLFGD